MKRILFALIISVLAVAGVARAEAGGSDGALSGNVEDKSRVCMIQDMVMAKPGIPVQHGGKTYYGCCPMCSGKIAEEPARHTTASDPVSGSVVDKADAHVFSLGGRAYYFESEASRARFAGDPWKYAPPESRTQQPRPDEVGVR